MDRLDQLQDRYRALTGRRWLPPTKTPIKMTDITPAYMTVTQAAIYASVSRKTILRMLHRGDIQGERTPGGERGPGHWRVKRESIDQYFSDDQVLAIVGSLGL